MDLKSDKLDQVLTALQPPPPPPPDPVLQALMGAEVELRQSTAGKNKAETAIKNLQALITHRELEMADENAKADVVEKLARAKNYLASAAKSEAESNNPVDKISSGLDNLMKLKNLGESNERRSSRVSETT
jgi:hypothetical protein